MISSIWIFKLIEGKKNYLYVINLTKNLIIQDKNKNSAYD